MTKVILEAGQVEIKKGYLSAKGEKMSPIGNKEFLAAQKSAEYIITFAEMAKSKNFVAKEADSLEEFKKEVSLSLVKKDKKFVAAPKKVKRVVTEKLKNEALAYINFKEESSKVDKINEYLTQFAIIDEFEEVGLFFEPEICKLNRIYTMKEIIDAVKSVIDLLD